MSSPAPRPSVVDITTLLKADEGFVAAPYPDSVHGVLTFGYGFTYLTKDESDKVLEIRLQNVTAALVAALPWSSSLTHPRFAVLQSMAYNLGVQGLLEWKTFLGLIESGEYSEAADDLEHNNPKYVAEVGARAHRLAEQLRSDLWQ